jgi:hypothetical protein
MIAVAGPFQTALKKPNLIHSTKIAILHARAIANPVGNKQKHRAFDPILPTKTDPYGLDSAFHLLDVAKQQMVQSQRLKVLKSALTNDF